MVHAIDITEITLEIARHLDATDLWNCAHVNRTFYAAFGPLVWRTILFNTSTNPKFLDTLKKQPKNLGEGLHTRSWARSIRLAPRRCQSNRPTQQPMRQRKRIRAKDIMLFLQKKAAWIQVLDYHQFHSPFEFDLGPECTGVQTLALRGGLLPFDETKGFNQDYYRSCDRLLRQNHSSLQNLTLQNWGVDRKQQQPFKIGPNLPLWSPFSSLVFDPLQQSALTTLELVETTIDYDYLWAFWDVCSRLEVLKAIDSDFALSLGPWPRPKVVFGEDGVSQQPAEEQQLLSLQPQKPRFPRLRELELKNFGLPNYLHTHKDTIRRLIGQCPLLRTLDWTLPGDEMFSSQEMANAFAVGTWPFLDSITIRGPRISLQSEDHLWMIKSARRPFKTFTVRVSPSFSLEAFDLLTKSAYVDSDALINTNSTTAASDHITINHFEHLCTLDLSVLKDKSQSYVLRALESCPMLEMISGQIIYGHEIVASSNKPWVCHQRLRVLSVMIGERFVTTANIQAAGTDGHGSPLPTLTPMGPWDPIILETVLTKLATLSRLEELDLNYHLYYRRPPLIAPLPLQLSKGLGKLSRLSRLKIVRCEGPQRMAKADLRWVYQHWPEIKVLDAFSFSTEEPMLDPRFELSETPTWDLVVKLTLKKYSIRVPSISISKDRCLSEGRALKTFRLDKSYK